ncbi:copper amine oxidase N-terminal domain-containing protein [Lysinibacillus sp. NPDC093688]|uniref:copper amine oxidase N-terminal domain-containing protein n=1 Tax=Lysinibacillus sp. NPDC093688 TaxID=3390577 RepID=UPI003CFF51DA
MRKIISLTFGLLIAFIFITTTPTLAEENTKTIEGAVIIEGRTLLPLRSIFESLGATVNWDTKTKTVIVKKGTTKIELPLNSKKVKVNGVTKTLDVPAKLIDSKTMVPVRFVSESLGAEVSWNKENQYALIKYQGQQIKVLAQNNNTSYLMDTNKMYTYKTVESDPSGNIIDTSYLTVKFVGKKGNAYTWSNNITWKEESNGLWVDNGDGWEKYLLYPVKQGATWKNNDDWYENNIISVSETVKTLAGTFKNCVVVDYNYQTLTFAKGIGLIKVEARGGYVVELASII